MNATVTTVVCVLIQKLRVLRLEDESMNEHDTEAELEGSGRLRQRCENRNIRSVPEFSNDQHSRVCLQ